MLLAGVGEIKRPLKGGKDVELVLVKIDQKANEVSDSEASNMLVCGLFLHVKTTRLN
jgi:hypothetical protein